MMPVPDDTAEQVKEYIEAILREKDRALAMADVEREKAAASLRIELARAISEGDERLREHVMTQYAQVASALLSAEKLEVERFNRLEASIKSLEEKLNVMHRAYETETRKFEESVTGRFTGVNEFRGSLDDLSKQMATRRELESLAQTTNSKIDEMLSALNNRFDAQGSQLQELRSRLDTGPAALRELQRGYDTGQGLQQGARQSQASLYALIAAVGGGLGIIIVLSNFLSSH